MDIQTKTAKKGQPEETATEPSISQKNFTLVTLSEKKTAAAAAAAAAAAMKPQSAPRGPRPRKEHATGLKEAVSEKKKKLRKKLFSKNCHLTAARSQLYR